MTTADEKTETGTPRYTEEAPCTKCGAAHAQVLTETMPMPEEDEKDPKKKKQLNE